MGDIVTHGIGRASEVGLGNDIRRAFGMGKDDGPRMCRPHIFEVRGGEAFVDFAASGPGDDLDIGLPRHIAG